MDGESLVEMDLRRDRQGNGRAGRRAGQRTDGADPAFGQCQAQRRAVQVDVVKEHRASGSGWQSGWSSVMRSTSVSRVTIWRAAWAMTAWPFRAGPGAGAGARAALPLAPAGRTAISRSRARAAKSRAVQSAQKRCTEFPGFEAPKTVDRHLEVALAILPGRGKPCAAHGHRQGGQDQPGTAEGRVAGSAEGDAHFPRLARAAGQHRSWQVPPSWTSRSDWLPSCWNHVPSLRILPNVTLPESAAAGPATDACRFRRPAAAEDREGGRSMASASPFAAPPCPVRPRTTQGSRRGPSRSGPDCTKVSDSFRNADTFGGQAPRMAATAGHSGGARHC